MIREVQRASGSDDKLAQSDREVRINILKIVPLQVDPVGQKVPKSIWAAPPNLGNAQKKGCFFLGSIPLVRIESIIAKRNENVRWFSD